MSVRLSSDIFDARHPVNPGDDQWTSIHHPCRGEAEIERQRFARAFLLGGLPDQSAAHQIGIVGPLISKAG
jgi:hypothetical protein